MKINYNKNEDLLPVFLSLNVWPFSGKALSRISGLSIGQVYYRLKQHRINLRQLRNGEQGEGRRLANIYTPTKITVEIHTQMARTHRKSFIAKTKTA